MSRGLYVILIMASLFGAGCAQHNGDSSSSSSAASGLQAFESGFYQFVNKQGCVQCHGASQSPTFAAPNIATAYAAAKGNQIGSTTPLIDFSNPSASIFVTYAGNNHCSATPCSNPAVAPQVTQLLTTWAQAELAAGGGG